MATSFPSTPPPLLGTSSWSHSRVRYCRAEGSYPMIQPCLTSRKASDLVPKTTYSPVPPWCRPRTSTGTQDTPSVAPSRGTEWGGALGSHPSVQLLLIERCSSPSLSPHMSLSTGGKRTPVRVYSKLYAKPQHRGEGEGPACYARAWGDCSKQQASI